MRLEVSALQAFFLHLSFFCFWVRSGGDLEALCSGNILSRFGEPYGMQGIELRLAMCKANALLTVLSGPSTARSWSMWHSPESTCLVIHEVYILLLNDVPIDLFTELIPCRLF